MQFVKLDGFTVEGFGRVIAGAIAKGDVVRDSCGTEVRWYPPEIEPPQPNTPDNPYFGKRAKAPKDFWGLLLSVYIARAGSNAGGLDRHTRLLASKRAAPIVKIIDGVTLVDPDDKSGDFLRLLGILTTTKHETDGGLLVDPAEADAFMAGWR